jgi:hypothetical protein
MRELPEVKEYFCFFSKENWYIKDFMHIFSMIIDKSSEEEINLIDLIVLPLIRAHFEQFFN